MLAEIYLLKLEAAVRAAKEAATTASTSRFVPVTNPAFHHALAICRLELRRPPRIQNNSGQPKDLPPGRW